MARLAVACVTAATQEGDKVRANAARALGHVVSASDFSSVPTPAATAAAATAETVTAAAAEAEGERPSTWLPEVVQALMSCLTTGNAKVQWNACHAMGALFHNPTAAAAGSAWAPLVVRMLLMLMRDSRNFKIRMHAAATLAAPGRREEFGNAYPDAVSVITNALEALDFDSGSNRGGGGVRGGGGGGGDVDASMMELKYTPQLSVQLTTTLLRVLAMGTVNPSSCALAPKILTFTPNP
jgi:uncharacterized membrane protein YgcG